MKRLDEGELLSISIPETANYQLPDDSLLQFYENLEERIIWISDEINIYTMNLFDYILKWNREDKGIEVEKRKPIKIFFFSCGGDLEVYRSLASLIELSKTPVWGYNCGYAYSAAAFILLRCHKRFALKTSSLLFHKGSASGISGTPQQIQDFMTEYQKQVAELSDIIKERTSYSEEVITEKMKSEWYIGAEEGVSVKIYDKIIDDIEELL